MYLYIVIKREDTEDSRSRVQKKPQRWIYIVLRICL